MLAAIWNAGMVMLKILKTSVPAAANSSRTAAMAQQANRAVRSRCSTVSLGVIVRNDGTAASGSTITNSELVASNMYSNKSITPELELNCRESQRGKIVSQFTGSYWPGEVARLKPTMISTLIIETARAVLIPGGFARI